MPIFTKKLFAENYVVTSSVTSMSIAQASGSTIFGDSADDTHLFIGSTISGSASSTASFGKYENITSFAGADGTETSFSGSSTSTGSFGKVLGAAIDTYDSSGDNRIITSVNSNTVQGESNLQFNGTTLTHSVSGGSVKIDFTGTGGASGYNWFLSANNDGGVRATHFVNGTSRGTDGGNDAYVIRNDGGPLQLGGQYGGATYGTTVEGKSVDLKGNVTASANLEVAENISGSAASTGSFGRAYIADTLNVPKIQTAHDTQLKIYNDNGKGLTLAGDSAYLGISNEDHSPRTFLDIHSNSGDVGMIIDAANMATWIQFRDSGTAKWEFAKERQSPVYTGTNAQDFIFYNSAQSHEALIVSTADSSFEFPNSPKISGSAASTGSFGALTLKKYNQAIGHTTNTNFGIGAGSTGAGEANVAIGHSAGDHDTGDLNVAIGYEAAADWTSTADGDRNIAIGYQSMYDHNGGDDNIAIGSSAMKDGEGNGADNIAIGTEALKNIGAGAARNIAIGGDAQKTQNGSATDNISIGYQSLYNNTVGDYNVAVGTETLYSVNDPSGHKNVGVGYRAGLFIANGSTEFTSGSSNVFIGAHAYPNAINDSNEVGIGANAIGKGSNTVTIGDDIVTDIYLSEDVGATVLTGNVSGSAASTGSFGTLKLSNANGDVDIRNYVDGDMNVVIGDSTTGAALTSGVDNIIIGQGIAAIQTGENNVYIGARAGAANNAANNNVAIGYQALVSGNGNSSNVAIGFRALYGNGSSLNNTAVGYEAGKNTTSGEESVFLGFRSGDTNTTGDKNVTLGVGADVSTADAQNQIAIGFNATSTGDNQTVIGNSDQTHVVFGGSAIISGSAASTGSFGALNIGGEKIRASSTGLLIGNDNTGAHNSEEVSIVGAVPLSLYANAGGGRPSVIFQNNVGDAEAATLQFRKSRSTTLGGHTVVQDDDQLGQVAWYASDGDSWEMAARIQAKIDGSPGNSDLPTEMIFSVAADGAGSPTDRLTISPAGTVSGDLNDTSDRALKKNIVPLEDSTEKVKKLNPVTFDWEDTGLGSIGFIAQEIEELYPDAVNGEEGKKSIKISGIVAALTKTVQSLIEKNEALEKRIKDLENN